jgi:hypothetical protein
MAYGCEKHCTEWYGWLTGVKNTIRNGMEAYGCEKHRTECYGWLTGVNDTIRNGTDHPRTPPHTPASPPVWAGDPPVWAGDPLVWAGDPQVWAGDPQVWAGDPRFWPGTGVGRGPGSESTRKTGQKKLILHKKRVHVKDCGKSYYQKLRRVMNFLFYDTDNSETSLKIHFCAKLVQIRKIQIFGPLRN